MIQDLRELNVAALKAAQIALDLFHTRLYDTDDRREEEIRSHLGQTASNLRGLITYLEDRETVNLAYKIDNGGD